MRVRFVVWISMSFLLAVAPAAAENWPCWRGPRGDGSSSETRVPIHWDGATGENIAWKVATPGAGHSSPIVWNERIFLTTCDVESRARDLVCLDRGDGRELWRRTVLTAPLETKHQLNSYASSTPATDGETVFVTFLEVDGETIPARNVSRARPVTPGRMVVAAYDFDGRQRWMARPGEFVSVHGFCTCPVLWEGLVIVNGDHDGDAYLAALDKTTGKTVWKTPREHKTRSYATPLVRDIGGRTQLILSGNKSICGYDPRTGKQIWKIDGPTEQFVASMVDDGRRLYMAAGFPTHHVMAVRPDGHGNVTDSHVVWHSTSVRCYVPSPVVLDGFLLVADDRGTANCFDTATGDRLWLERLGTHYSASLVSANGLAYFMADNGETKVVRPDRELVVVAENALGEYCFASPAISNGQLFVRGEEHLFCLGQPTSASEPDAAR